MGVEEEFLLVDPETGTPRAVAHLALAREPGGDVTGELHREQVETATRPCPTLDDLGRELRRARVTAGRAAGAAGSVVAALGTSPLPVEPTLWS